MQIKNPLAFIARRIYRGLKPILYKNKNQRTVRALGQLCPWENKEKLYEEYQVRKLTLVLAVLLIGTGAAVLLHLCSRMEGRLAEGSRLNRNEWGAGDYLITLWADVGDWCTEIPFLVKERQLSAEEREELLGVLQRELPDVIKKNNQDLQHVMRDLNLVSSVKGYPFKLVWSSENNKRVRRDGKVDRTGVGAEGERVVLTAEACYEKESTCFNYEVFLMPEIFSEEESFFRDLDTALSEIDVGSAAEKQLLLPGVFNGKNIAWKEKRTDKGMMLFLLSLAGCVLIGRGAESDLMRSCRKRDKQLQMKYPDFVSKLRLYLSAGLTAKRAFIRILSDYESSRGNEKVHYLYEEMKISCYQLENGMAEEQVYQEFGKRCGKTQYRRLGFLLSMHLKQGNSQLLTILSQEADSAQEDKRNMARKAGEEAGTKLLLPMMLMLIVIMFLILIPVYMDFGSI